MGRPRHRVDWKKLDTLTQFGPTLVMAAELIGMQPDTLQNHIKEKYGWTWTQYRERKITHTKMKLINKALALALSGNVALLIFSLKNMCGWQDKPDVTDKGEEEKYETPDTLTASKDEDAPPAPDEPKDAEDDEPPSPQEAN